MKALLIPPHPPSSFSSAEIAKKMTSAQDYGSLMDGVRGVVLTMIERAASRKRKGEGLVVMDREQCQRFIDQNLEMVREQSWLDGAIVRAMTLVRNDRHPSRAELSLGVTAVGASGVVATKAVKKWGAKAGTGAADQRTRRSSTEERLGSPKTSKAGSVLETERTLRAPKDAAITVQLREARGSEAPSSSVRLTVEEIFQEGNGRCWLGEKDSDHIYCTMKQTYGVNRDFSWLLSCVQVFGFIKLQQEAK